MPIGETTPPAISETATAPPPRRALLLRALGFFQWLGRFYAAQQERHRLRSILYKMSETELKDIGLARAEIERIAAHKALDRLRDAAIPLGLPRI